MDWSLLACATTGHVTYAPAEQVLRDKLHIKTSAGEGWRCLRCGDFVLGDPRGEGPAEDAPLILRGRQLRDAFILRFLAVERGLRGLLILTLAYGVYRFSNAQETLSRVFKEDLPLLRPLADKVGYDLEESAVVHTLRSALDAKHSTLIMIALGLVAYGLIQIIEAIGLWLLKRWGEYVAVIATSIFLPLEIYELIERVTVTRVGALVINLAAIVYLLVSKRLFGLRGGKAAYEAERHSESHIEVETVAGGGRYRGVKSPARPRPAP